ncbi:hypothetical protein Avbf_18127, partial [Armadillidium vulgare]
SYEVCPDGDTEVSLILCRKATRVCLPCQSEENICDEGKYFSMQDSKCYSDPDTPEMTCLSTNGHSYTHLHLHLHLVKCLVPNLDFQSCVPTTILFPMTIG